MEYVDGANLRQLIESGELAPETAISIVPQVCESLQFAHDQGIVHRDIKPENILVDSRGMVKIADFGLARLTESSAKDFTLTGTHQVMGTPRYMAPEQMEGSHDVDHRADIYSLGVVFYEMLTGEVPAGHFDPPSKKVQIDVRLDEVVLRSLAREPERRYQQVSEVKSEVEAISGSAQRHVSTTDAASLQTELLSPGKSANQVDPAQIRSVERKVQRVASVLFAAGLTVVVSGLLFVFVLEFEPVPLDASPTSIKRTDSLEFTVLGLQLATIPVAVLAMLASWDMKRFESRKLAVIASVLVLVPWTPGWLIAMPLGLWSLVVLCSPEVQRMFAAHAEHREAGRPFRAEQSLRLSAAGNLPADVILGESFEDAPPVDLTHESDRQFQQLHRKPAAARAESVRKESARQALRDLSRHNPDPNAEVSRKAIAGAAMILVGGLLFPVFILAADAANDTEVALFLTGLFSLLALITAVGVSFLGVVAIEEIRRSAGRVRGLRLAFMDVVLCPTIAINVVLVILSHILSIRILHDLIRDLSGPGSSMIQAIGSALLGLLPIVVVIAQGVITFRILRGYWQRISGPWPSEETAAQRPRPDFCWRAASGLGLVLIFFFLATTLVFGVSEFFSSREAVLVRAIATAICGLASCLMGVSGLRQIRDSNGRLWGRGLAFANAAVFPIVLLDSAIFGLVLLALRGFGGEGLLTEAAALYSVPLWLIVDWLVLSRKWTIEKSRAHVRCDPGPGSRPSGGQSGSADLDSAEEAVQPEETSSDTPDFSRVAMVGAVASIVLICGVVIFGIDAASIAASSRSGGPLTEIFASLILPSGLAATICGIVALIQIRNSNGIITGLSLAIAEVLAFPVLLVFASIFGLSLYFFSSGLEMNFAMSFCLATVQAALIGGWLASDIVKRFREFVSGKLSCNEEPDLSAGDVATTPVPPARSSLSDLPLSKADSNSGGAAGRDPSHMKWSLVPALGVVGVSIFSFVADGALGLPHWQLRVADSWVPLTLLWCGDGLAAFFAFRFAFRSNRLEWKLAAFVLTLISLLGPSPE
jgi:hypothetical protein